MDQQKPVPQEGKMEASVKTYTSTIIQNLKQQDQKFLLDSETLLGGCEIKTILRGSLIDTMIQSTVCISQTQAYFFENIKTKVMNL
jgi:hypothetical protein